MEEFQVSFSCCAAFLALLLNLRVLGLEVALGFVEEQKKTEPLMSVKKETGWYLIGLHIVKD